MPGAQLARDNATIDPIPIADSAKFPPLRRARSVPRSAPLVRIDSTRFKGERDRGINFAVTREPANNRRANAPSM
jgi:hypothetical protein